ncbi:MAG: hypothetical protein ACLP52_00230 [Streptosporangiaceae bacterium]
MSRSEAPWPAAQSGPDVIASGPARPPARWRSRWLAMAALLIAAAVAVAAIRHDTAPHAARAAAPQVRVTVAGHRLLGVRSGWDLFGLGPGGLVRIELARGRITRTAVPGAQVTTPVSVAAGPAQAIIRPLDEVPGYLVPDGRPPRSPPPALSHGGSAVPGPEPGEVWAVSADSSRMTLYSLTDRTAGPTVPLPHGPWVTGPDGRGGVLLENDNGAFYDGGPRGVRLITTGAVAAVGPAGWLTVACRYDGRCADVMISPGSGRRRVLPGRLAATPASVGAISPDGSTAAVFQQGTGSRIALTLISLSSGRTRRVPLALRGPLGSPALAWSPDSRWLFTVAADGQLLALDPRTGQLRGLGVRLPPLTELAVRGTSPPAR